MRLTSRVRQLERWMAPLDRSAIALTDADHARFARLFESAERLNGPPPSGPDGALTSNMKALAAWIDAVPDDWAARFVQEPAG